MQTMGWSETENTYHTTGASRVMLRKRLMNQYLVGEMEAWVEKEVYEPTIGGYT